MGVKAAAELLIKLPGCMVPQGQQVHGFIHSLAGVAFGLQVMDLPFFQLIPGMQPRHGKGVLVQRKGKLAVKEQRIAASFCFFYLCQLRHRLFVNHDV